MPESASVYIYFRVHGDALPSGRPVMYVQSARYYLLPYTFANRSLALGKLREKLCNIAPQSRERSMVLINITMGTLSLLAVSLRLTSRYLVCKRLWWEDGIILAAMASYFRYSYERKAYDLSRFLIFLLLGSLAGVWILPNICMICTMGLTCLSVQMNGLGKHIWDVSITKIPKIFLLCMNPPHCNVVMR
jgi:hypothetical protein